MPDLPITFDLSFYRGDTSSKTFRLLNGGSPINLDDVSIKASALHLSSALISDLGIVVEPDPGVITLEIPMSMRAGAYRYNIKLTESNGKVTTWVKGDLQLEKEVPNVV
jgi:hypothetical protein